LLHLAVGVVQIRQEGVRSLSWECSGKTSRRGSGCSTTPQFTYVYASLQRNHLIYLTLVLSTETQCSPSA
jgi:hypothetical protein